MSVERLIQMSQFGLKGNAIISNKTVVVKNVSYNENDNVIAFSVEESQGSYGAISFPVDAILEIAGCEDKENPEEYLNVNIKLNDGVTIIIKILYQSGTINVEIINIGDINWMLPTHKNNQNEKEI